MNNNWRILRKTLGIISIVTALIFAGILAIFILPPAPAFGETINVGTEKELRDAVNKATEPTVINLTADIKLSSEFEVYAGKDIAFTGNYKLIGYPSYETIKITGKVTVEGITVTHEPNKGGKGKDGRGISVYGTLIMLGGEISGNWSIGNGGGVFIHAGADFTMKGGSISGNESLTNAGGMYNEGTVTMIDGSLSGNKSHTNGGGVYNSGTFIMRNGKISGNSCIDSKGGESEGGGIFNSVYGIFTMENGEIFGNECGSDGAGVSNYDYSVFTMKNGKIYNNRTTGPDSWGGGVKSSGSTFIMEDGEIFGNTAMRDGGGVFVTDSLFEMNGGKIYNNEADRNGGGVFCQEYSTFTMKGGKIFNNKVGKTGYGGGVCGEYSTISLKTVEIIDNTAFRGGGAFVSKSSLNVTGGHISDNTAKENGGGIFIDSQCAFTAEDVLFEKNTAKWGGAILCREDNARVIGCTFIYNNAEQGGAVYARKLESVRSDFVENISTGNNGGGGAIACQEGTVQNSSFSKNTSVYDGGAIWAVPMTGRSGIATVTDSTFSQNRTAGNGGAICVKTRSGIGDETTITSCLFEANEAVNGGGIYIAELAKLQTNGVTFTGNTAAQTYNWALNGTQDALIHNANILDSLYTLPFSNAYNNADVNYVYREAILHIRQVVINSNDFLSVPVLGFMTFKTLKNDDMTLMFSANAVTDSNKYEMAVPYSKYELPVLNGYEKVQVNCIIPEYYTLSGYTLTSVGNGSDHSALPERKGHIIIVDYTAADEYYLTIYLRPGSTDPGAYDWDYAINQLGKIKFNK